MIEFLSCLALMAALITAGSMINWLFNKELDDEISEEKYGRYYE